MCVQTTILPTINNNDNNNTKKRKDLRSGDQSRLDLVALLSQLSEVVVVPREGFVKVNYVEQIRTVVTKLPPQ